MNRIVRNTTLAFALLSLLTVGAQSRQATSHPVSDADEKSARLLADEFLKDALSGKTNDAARLWDPEFLSTADASWIRSKFIAPSLQRCGQPRWSALNNSGEPALTQTVSSDGTTRTGFIYLYFFASPQGGKRRFQIEIGRKNAGEFHVTGFGCNLLNPRPIRSSPRV